MSAQMSVRHEEREREMLVIARLAREAAEQHTVADHPVRRRVRVHRIRWARVIALGTSGGVFAGLVTLAVTS